MLVISGVARKDPDEHLIFLGMEKDVSRPEWTIMKVLPVPPITVRPSITWKVEIDPRMT